MADQEPMTMTLAEFEESIRLSFAAMRARKEITYKSEHDYIAHKLAHHLWRSGITVLKGRGAHVATHEQYKLLGNRG